MIIDLTQNKDSIDISYVKENKQIGIEKIIFDAAQLVSESGEKIFREYHNFVECLESDPNVHTKLKSFYGKPIKLDKAHYFTHHNLNYFLNYEIPNFYKDSFQKFNKIAIPNPFSIDIETDITDEYGYSTEDKAENPIRSISFTDFNLNTLLFIVKNPQHPEFNDLDRGYIDAILKDSLGEYYNKFEYQYNIKVFNTEYEMLNYFIHCFREYFHMLIGWNVYKYDWQYIYNRCEKLGIEVKKASPTGKLVNKDIEINEATHIKLKIPAHRIIIDYMILFKESLIYNNLGKYNLDSISEMVLGLNKVSYKGNLRTLYETDYLRFVAYALIDTILVMLIHKATNLLGIDFFNSYYTGVPYLKLSQNSISEGLIFNELIKDNMFLLESEKSKLPPRPYQGGYVKSPTDKIVGSVAGFDFSSLYPNSMVTIGISPEAKIDSLHCGPDGFPDNEPDRKKWEEYKKLGYCLSPMGRVYDVSKDFLFTRIEKGLLKERKIYKGYMGDIYLNVLTQIEEEIKKRENNL